MQQSADIGAGDKRQRDEHEEREEAQLSLAEPCLAHHVQLGRPEHVLLGSAEHGLLFLVAVGEVKVCREARNKTMRIFRKKPALWRQQEAHQLASAHAQVFSFWSKRKILIVDRECRIGAWNEAHVVALTCTARVHVGYAMFAQLCTCVFEFVAIPGDVAYLEDLQEYVDGDDVLQARHVVYYHNRTLSDHKITLIKSW